MKRSGVGLNPVSRLALVPDDIAIGPVKLDPFGSDQVYIWGVYMAGTVCSQFRPEVVYKENQDIGFFNWFCLFSSCLQDGAASSIGIKEST